MLYYVIYRKKPTETDTFHSGAFGLHYAAHWRNGQDITTPPSTLSIPSLLFFKKSSRFGFFSEHLHKNGIQHDRRHKYYEQWLIIDNNILKTTKAIAVNEYYGTLIQQFLINQTIQETVFRQKAVQWNLFHR